MSTKTAAVVTPAKSEEAEPYFQGTLNNKEFKADFRTHTLKDNFWFAAGTMEIPGVEISKQVITFKYSVDRALLPSGRYELLANNKDPRFAVIFMTYSDTPTPAYEAERGQIEFFHDINNNTVSGAFNVYYHDVDNHEVHAQILFNIF